MSVNSTCAYLVVQAGGYCIQSYLQRSYVLHTIVPLALSHVSTRIAKSLYTKKYHVLDSNSLQKVYKPKKIVHAGFELGMLSVRV